ncbi:BTAD domain-containing putative transcriptional regulator [Micromonospora sp. NPDC049559]|uniref:AfsR/SARP family transcriptional regulator n=1 Tax=Micromonospora sp. NPDC049559 TaxID=3155923 RepID=UPI00341EA260
MPPTPPPAAVTEFQLLGPVRAYRAGRQLPIGRRRERCLLAVLLLEANRPVAVARLLDLLWDGEPPDSARASLHTHVSRLRGCLDPDGDGDAGVRLHARDGGYLLETDRDRVDAHRFTDAVAGARELGDAAARAALLRRALARWRGPALADTASGLLYQRVAAELDELRLVATELALDAELECGRHERLVGELTGLVADHPLREGLWERLALALYRSGRQAEALAALGQARQRFAEELGLEPGPRLRRLQRAILTGDPELSPPAAREPTTGAAGGPPGSRGGGDAAAGGPPTAGGAGGSPGRGGDAAAGGPTTGTAGELSRSGSGAAAAGPPTAGDGGPRATGDGPAASDGDEAGGAVRAPRQLPMDIPQFTGREHEIGQLEAIAKLVPERLSDGSTGTVVCVVEGMAGVGKTRLAIHAAHRLVGQGRFDEIQLWADLRGFDPDRRPADPAAVLETFVRLLGVPGQQVPDSLEARAALYRDHLAGRRALVLLDNAASEEQVRPLLPGSATCFVLVTSRHHLTGLEGALPLPLDVFTPREAVDLLARVAGHQRVAAQPEQAARIAELCGHLPIAVTLAARRLQARPSWTMGELVSRLDVADQRLGQLSAGRQAVQATFDMSYQALTPPQQGLFRLLGLHPGDDVTAEAAAALADTSRHEADGLLEALLDEHLLQQSTPDRYRMHDLVRLYARDLAQREEPGSRRDGSLARLLRHYLAGAEQATRLLHPTESRRVSGTAHSGGAADPGWRGAAPLGTPAAAIAWTEANLANMVAAAYQAAETPGAGPSAETPDAGPSAETPGAGPPPPGADARGGLPGLVVRLIVALYRPLANRGHSRERISLNQLAVRIARRTGDRHGEAQALEDLGTIYGQIGALDEAIEYNERALAAWRRIGNRIGEVGCLVGLGITYRQLERYEEAVAQLRAGLAVSQEIGNEAGRCSILNHLGLVQQALGHFDEAIASHRESIDRCHRRGDVLGEAIALANLGWAYQRSGRGAPAVECHGRALALFESIEDRYNVAEQLWGLGQAHHLLGDPEGARAYWRRSTTLLREMGMTDLGWDDDLPAGAAPELPEIIRLNT